LTAIRLPLSRRALLGGIAIGAGAALWPARGFAAAPMPVVASFSILGDLVKNVGGERVAVTTLVGPNGDAHVYQPTPADGRALAEAKVIFMNGLSFEGWMPRLIGSAKPAAPVFEAAGGIEPLPTEEHDHDHGHAHGASHDHDHAAEAGHDHGHDHGEFDPHAWQSVPNVKKYVEVIRDCLLAADAEGAATYRANAEDYLAKLTALDAEIRAGVESIPEARRKVITSHDAFAYFEAAYGVEFIAPQGVSTESEASARDVARIIRQIKRLKVPAVFVENISDPRLIKRIADETGARVGGTLYSDALSDDSGPASTYLDMMRSNLRELTAALSA
jgi:zinc/manganese transport system substrate-binding protein